MINIKKAVVTGATGAIGVALVKELIQQGVDVLVIARRGSKRLDRLPKDKVRILMAELPEYAQITSASTALDEKAAGEDYDAFFHLSWAGTIGDGRNDMYLQNKNVEYTLDAVALAHRLGCKVFLGAGSQAEYGRTEEKISASLPTNPENGYGIAKLCAGMMSREECHKYGMKHIWVRILSVYGPYDGEMTMVISAIRKMLAGECPAFSKGEQQWDYLYSHDAARALILASEKGEDGKIYPIGSGNVSPLAEYIEEMRCAVSELSGKAAQTDVGVLPYRDRQVMYLCADISELTEDTGFVPEVPFEKGIRETVAWCMQ